MLILTPLAGQRILGRPRAMPLVRPRFASLANLAGAVGPDVLAALRSISRDLAAAGVRHLVIGGLAVGVYGWPRATRDVDLLLGDEAWDRAPDGELRPRLPLPEVLGGVAVDYLPLDIAGGFLGAALDAPLLTEGLPIAPPEVVVCTKLLRLAMRDQADIVEMLKAGLFERAAVRAYLAEHTPMLLGRWEALAEQADVELRRE